MSQTSNWCWGHALKVPGSSWLPGWDLPVTVQRHVLCAQLVCCMSWACTECSGVHRRLGCIDQCYPAVTAHCRRSCRDSSAEQPACAVQVVFIPMLAPRKQSARFIFTTFYTWQEESLVDPDIVHSNVRLVLLAHVGSRRAHGCIQKPSCQCAACTCLT